MLTLIGIGFLVGILAGVSPCIIPVIPVVLAGGISGARGEDNQPSAWRPLAIVLGIVTSFTIFELFGLSLLTFLHLPDDLQTKVGVVLLLVIAISMLVPWVATQIERPFSHFQARPARGTASGLVLGLSLGLVFVPCAGPLLSALSTIASARRVGVDAIFVTIAFALGATLPLLILAAVAQRTAAGWKSVRRHVPTVRRVGGVVLGIMAVALWFNWLSPLQTTVPGYAASAEHGLDGSGSAKCRLIHLARPGQSCNSQLHPASGSGEGLQPYGPAPDFTGITAWLNTPGDTALSLSQFRGKVVLVDFWTYSCINCQRSLPHVEAWYNTYKDDGLMVVGVHTPEFAFEHVVSNVSTEAARLRVDYPIAVDNNYGTWNAYGNDSWPAEYLIDQTGEIRYESVGEGDYSQMELNIRALLTAGGATNLPPATQVADRTPEDLTTAETYLGEQYITSRQEPYVGDLPNSGTPYQFTLPTSLTSGQFAFGGNWTLDDEGATAGTPAELQLSYQATDVYLVLGGQGTVAVSVNGRALPEVSVSGPPALYRLVSGVKPSSGLLDIKVSPGVEAYDFTFG